MSELNEKTVEAAKEVLDNLAETARAAGEKMSGVALEAAKAAVEATRAAAAAVEEKAQETAEVLEQKTADAAAEKAEEAIEKSEEAAVAAEEKAEEAAPAESMADYEEQINASFKQVHEGDILTGTVIGISDDEIVLDFGSYTDGVIKLKDASDDPNFSFSQMEIGQQVSGTVIKRDNGEGRLQLSMKEAAAVLAWDRLKKLMDEKTPVRVKISQIVKGGAVAYLEGIRGFIPASRLSLTYVEDLNQFQGQEMDVLVITADESEKRLVLSAREILREKAEEERKNRVSNVEVGLVTEGTVESLKPYGAFVRLGNGLSGLLHVSQISQQRIKHPSAVLEEGQTVKVKVIGTKDGKISLSMKALEDNTAKEIVEEKVEIPASESISTSLGDLLKGLKL